MKECQTCLDGVIFVEGEGGDREAVDTGDFMVRLDEGDWVLSSCWFKIESSIESKDVEQLLSADSDMASLELELAAAELMQFKLIGSVVICRGSDFGFGVCRSSVFLLSITFSLSNLGFTDFLVGTEGLAALVGLASLPPFPSCLKVEKVGLTLTSGLGFLGVWVWGAGDLMAATFSTTLGLTSSPIGRLNVGTLGAGYLALLAL